MSENTVKNWSAQQTLIHSFFTSGTGNLVIRARAGTGKTTTIMAGVDLAPEAKILLCAFNKRIATELQAKLRNPRAEAKTLHSLGYAYIRKACPGVKPDDKIEAERVNSVGPNAPDEIKNLAVKLLSKAKNCKPFATREELIDLAIDFDLTPSEDMEREGHTLARLAGLTFEALEVSKKPNAAKLISFDDMVWLPVVCGLVKPWYDLVVVDEAQDMNVCQLIIAQKACKKGGRVVVVGDDRQAIYGFRGADSDGIDRLKKELNAQELGLTVTYRCPVSVVNLAKTLVPDYEAGEGAPNGLVDDLDFQQIFEHATVGDFVLSRKNAPLMSVCMGFLKRGIRARVEGREIGQGLVNLVKKMKSPKSMVTFLAKLTRWKDKEIERAKARDNQAAVDRVADQYDTLVTLAEGLTGVPELEARITSLFSDTDNGVPSIVCSSVHKAKGLEADRVFVLADTLYPRQDIEEHNIAYVAYTRAKRHLTLVEGLPGDKVKEAA